MLAANQGTKDNRVETDRYTVNEISYQIKRVNP